MRKVLAILGAGAIVLIALIGVISLESTVTLHAGLPYVRAEAFVTAIRESQRVAYGGRDAEIMCLELAGADPPEDVMRALIARVETVVLPRSRCVQERAVGRSMRSVVVDPVSGKRGLLIRVSEPRRTLFGSTAIDVSYYQNPLSAAQWTCTVRMDIRWRVSSCRMTGMS